MKENQQSQDQRPHASAYVRVIGRTEAIRWRLEVEHVRQCHELAHMHGFKIGSLQIDRGGSMRSDWFALKNLITLVELGLIDRVVAMDRFDRNPADAQAMRLQELVDQGVVRLYVVNDERADGVAA